MTSTSGGPVTHAARHFDRRVAVGETGHAERSVHLGLRRVHRSRCIADATFARANGRRRFVDHAFRASRRPKSSTKRKSSSSGTTICVARTRCVAPVRRLIFAGLEIANWNEPELSMTTSRESGNSLSFRSET